jgi:Kef-type K+ transport system membrane component KefB
VAGVEITQLAWIGVAAVAAPLVATRLPIPGVVLELALGVLLGPAVLGWVSPTGVILDCANFGLALLMFLAGLELNLPVMRGRYLRLALGSWAGSLIGAAVVAGVLLSAGHRHGEVVIGLSLTTTALGTVLPIVRDAGVLHTSFGYHVLAIGSVAEFGPIVLVALLLGGDHPVITAVLILAFGLLASGFGIGASRPWGRRLTSWLQRGLHSSSQLPVRAAMLLIVALVFLTSELGLDILLGAFAAGVVVRVALSGPGPDVEAEIFQGKMEAIGFGLFVPVFFIVSGAKLDLQSFAHHPQALAAIPMFVLLLVLVRGAPTLLTYRNTLPTTRRVSLSLLAATGLPLIVVITAIGTANRYVATQTAAALVTAGVLTVLILPAVAMRLVVPGYSRLATTGDERDAL